MGKIKNHIHHILRWIEKYTKTDMLYLAHGSFWSTLSQVVVSITVFISAIIISNILPKEVYGEYKYVLATVAILSTFSLSGLGSAIFQSVANGYDGAIYDGFKKNMRWSILMFIGAFVLAAYYFAMHNYTLAFGVLIGGCLSPLLVSANLADAFLTAKKDFARSAIYFGIIETTVSAVALVIGILLTHNVLILVSVYFISNTLSTLLIYRRVINVYKPDIKNVDPKMLTYSKHLSLMGILSGIAGSIDEMLVFHFVGPAELAIYTFAVAIPDQTKGPLKTLNNMIQAKFVSHSNEAIHTNMRNKMFWLFVFSTLFISAYIIAAPFIYGLFFPKYTAAILYSQVYLWMSIFTLIKHSVYLNLYSNLSGNNSLLYMIPDLYHFLL